VALAWPNHVHHEAAAAWFRRARKAGWATCPATQAGFVRVSSNSRAIPGAVSPRAAFEVLSRITALPGHRFYADDVDLSASDLVFRERIVGFRQVTDAHLLAVAIRNGGRLATFDRGLLDLVPEGMDPDDAVTILRAAA
jgi:toxin-antitoxin system PIN domain toxin